MVCGRENSPPIPLIVEKEGSSFASEEKNAHFWQICCVTDWTSCCQCHSSCYPATSDREISSHLLKKSKCLNRWRVLISVRYVAMMGLVIKLWNNTVRVFRFILVLLLICIIYLAIILAKESLPKLFLYLKMTTVNSKWITVLFLCGQVFFSRSVREFQSGSRPGDSTIN